jgi:hypothetical protein
MSTTKYYTRSNIVDYLTNRKAKHFVLYLFLPALRLRSGGMDFFLGLNVNLYQVVETCHSILAARMDSNMSYGGGNR